MARVPVSAQSQLGTIRIPVDGYWNIDDLRNVSESLCNSYGYFYALVVQDIDVSRKMHELIQRRFWSGDIEANRFGNYLYSNIPETDGLRLRSFNYNSPGAMEFVGVLGALWMCARVARAWVAASSEFVQLWERVEKFFESRGKRFKKPKQKQNLDEDLTVGIDEARILCIQVADKLFGLDEEGTGRIIKIAGNPISALKLLVALSNEARKLSNMEKDGKLILPQLPSTKVEISQSDTRITKNGTRVETLGRKKK
jgi:hypothetical protein